MKMLVLNDPCAVQRKERRMDPHLEPAAVVIRLAAAYGPQVRLLKRRPYR